MVAAPHCLWHLAIQDKTFYAWDVRLHCLSCRGPRCPKKFQQHQEKGNLKAPPVSLFHALLQRPVCEHVFASSSFSARPLVSCLPGFRPYDPAASACSRSARRVAHPALCPGRRNHFPNGPAAGTLPSLGTGLYTALSAHHLSRARRQPGKPRDFNDLLPGPPSRASATLGIGGLCPFPGVRRHVGPPPHHSALLDHPCGLQSALFPQGCLVTPPPRQKQFADQTIYAEITELFQKNRRCAFFVGTSRHRPANLGPYKKPPNVDSAAFCGQPAKQSDSRS